ncbi:Extracellular ligand-binding receptor [Parafrankia sp. EUN1f]|nr:Extracellular ligand-binding receptor [Parafrankia sp. EUN1f]
MRIKYSAACCAAALFSATTLSACLGGTTAADRADCNTPGVTANQVNAGLIYPDTGMAADVFTAFRAGVDARFGAANAAGGVNGRHLVLTPRNDESTASLNLAVSQELIEKERVFAVLEGSVVTGGGAEYLMKAGVPVVGLAVEDVWAKNRNMFTFAYNFSGTGTVNTFGKFAKKYGGTRAIIYHNALDSSVSTPFADQFTTSFNAVGIPSSLVAGDNDPSASQIAEVIRHIRADGADTFVGNLDAPGTAKIISAVRDAGLQLNVILSAAQAPTPELLAQYGTNLAGVTTFTSYLPLEVESAANTAYRNAISAYAPSLQNANETLALVGYLVGDIYVRGLEEAGDCPTRQGFIDGLRAVKDYNAGGLTNKIDFDADFGKVEQCYSFSRVNAAGTGMEVVETDFCGDRLD